MDLITIEGVFVIRPDGSFHLVSYVKINFAGKNNVKYLNVKRFMSNPCFGLTTTNRKRIDKKTCLYPSNDTSRTESETGFVVQKTQSQIRQRFLSIWCCYDMSRS